MSKKVQFITTIDSADYTKGILPAQKNVPKWYKSIPIIREGDMTYSDNGGVNNLTVKHCLPFYDAMTFGYQIVLPSDLRIKTGEESFEYNYPTIQVIDHRDTKPAVPLPSEFVDSEFTWKMIWAPKTPKGYSCLITHPLNRTDLPFHTLSGIIDSDVFFHTPHGNLPFYMRKNFDGIIKKGTPIAQVIPFKRDNWKSVHVEYDAKAVNNRNKTVLSVFRDFYKKFAYVKKIFK